MIADPATYPTPNTLHSVASRRPISAYKSGETLAGADGLHLLADTRGTGPRGPHPGDILYWVACLGGACLLLFAAT
jgi:hypothetical protein